MNFDYSLLLLIGLGILLGGILFSKGFRISFFRGFRKFLAGLGQGARSYNRQYTGGKKDKQEQRGDPRDVRHRYIQDHHLVKCTRCLGTGQIPKDMPGIMDKRLAGKLTKDCPDCDGTGRVFD